MWELQTERDLGILCKGESGSFAQDGLHETHCEASAAVTVGVVSSTPLLTFIPRAWSVRGKYSSAELLPLPHHKVF